MDLCQARWMACGAPREAALCVSNEPGARERDLYFTSRMAEICAPVIAPFGPIPVDRPGRADVAILLMNGDGRELFDEGAAE
jgi:hypothetical protein